MEVLELFDDVAQREKIDADIKKFRKGKMQLKVVDYNGEPYSNATISLKQKKHEFKFGVTLFLLDEMETEEKTKNSNKTSAILSIWELFLFIGTPLSLSEEIRDFLLRAKRFIADRRLIYV